MLLPSPIGWVRVAFSQNYFENPSMSETLLTRQANEIVAIGSVETVWSDAKELARVFTDRELATTAGADRGTLLAAKRACGRLVAREMERGRVTLRDFQIAVEGGDLRLETTAAGQAAFDRYRLGAVHLARA